jgi:hypothetical protein
MHSDKGGYWALWRMGSQIEEASFTRILHCTAPIPLLHWKEKKEE